jgi:cell division septation protein DedD
MEEETTWKGHTFTLLVFSGIVVLCSIFFILGMLMGRTQGQKMAANAVAADIAKADAKPQLEDDKPDLTFYDAVKKEQPAVLEPAPEKTPDPAPPSSAAAEKPKPPEPAPPVTSKRENVVNYQIGALRKSEDAEKLLSAVKKKGFRAFILTPAADDRTPLFRVQVGPFSDPIDAQKAKKKLEGAGYQPILKK